MLSSWASATAAVHINTSLGSALFQEQAWLMGTNNFSITSVDLLKLSCRLSLTGCVEFRILNFFELDLGAV